VSQAVRDNRDLLTMPASGRSPWVARISDHVATWKLRITSMVAITTAIGYLLGTPLNDVAWLTLIATIIGASLSCMGASVFNQVFERETDALMQRTADRPLPARRLSLAETIVMGTVLSCLGVGLLAWLANPLSAALSAGTIISYVLFYTPMKPISSTALFIGAVPGAMPPMIGYAAATGMLSVEAYLVFAIMFVWQVPHFIAIAWLYKEDYARAGMPMIPVKHPEGSVTFWWIVGSSAVLLITGLLPTLLGYAGWGFFVVSLLAGGAMLIFAMSAFLKQTLGATRMVFFMSLIYLPIVLAALVIDAVNR